MSEEMIWDRAWQGLTTVGHPGCHGACSPAQKSSLCCPSSSGLGSQGADSLGLGGASMGRLAVPGSGCVPRLPRPQTLLPCTSTSSPAGGEQGEALATLLASHRPQAPASYPCTLPCPSGPGATLSICFSVLHQDNGLEPSRAMAASGFHGGR